MHKEMSVAALEAGKHVFCQRMAMNLTEAKAMVAAAHAHPGASQHGLPAAAVRRSSPTFAN